MIKSSKPQKVPSINDYKNLCANRDKLPNGWIDKKISEYFGDNLTPKQYMQRYNQIKNIICGNSYKKAIETGLIHDILQFKK